jgi:hypothetical protein
VQTKEDPTPERAELMNLLMQQFTLAARLRGYDVYRVAGGTQEVRQLARILESSDSYSIEDALGYGFFGPGKAQPLNSGIRRMLFPNGQSTPTL